MKAPAKLIQLYGFLALGALWFLQLATAQDYTFVTLAGAPEAGAGWHDGAGGVARFYYPSGVAVDSGGTVYVVDDYNHTIRKIAPGGAVTTLAGVAGSPGTNNGTGSAARFTFPFGATVDTGGNVYVADSDNQTIRKITPTGVVTTLAGLAGSPGSANGSGSGARFNYPLGAAVDAGGNVYVADYGNHTIRKITAAGAVTTLAGFAGSPGTNNGTGNAARFNYPSGVAVDADTNVYVADYGNRVIRKITPGGVVTTLAGLAGSAGSTDGTNGTARFCLPVGVAVDSSANVYVTDSADPSTAVGNHTVRKITPAGGVTTLAGLAGFSGSADGTNGTARFDFPSGLGVDTGGNVYVADYGNHTLRKITPGGIVTTLAGQAISSGTADGTGSVARFNLPTGVAADAGAKVYVADSNNHTIRKIGPGGEMATLAGLAGSAGTNDATGSAARFNHPESVALDGATNVYVADTSSHTIRKITPDGVVTTLAGFAGSPGTNDGIGGAARFNTPAGVAVDSATNVYVADTYNYTIRKITPAGVVTTLAGLAGSSGNADGNGGMARFYVPFDLTVDSATNVYVADTYNHTIRKITPSGVVTTLAGLPGNPGSADGTGSAARFNYPGGVAVDSGGNVYVADTFYNQYNSKITPEGVVTTIAGLAGNPGTADGTGGAVRFNTPYGIGVDNEGNLFVADTSNHTIRKGYPALSDSPVIDLRVAAPGMIRHLDVTNLTTTSWAWSFIRYPATSATQLSSITNRNPTFTPDLADLYVIRFEGRDNSGRVATGTLAVNDATLPQVNITSPTSGQRWSNTLFTVTGTASDNVGVDNVWYQLNSSAWTLAVGKIHWTASLTLTRGTNVVRAYAVDTSGNVSVTNSVSFICVPGGLLNVLMTGRGTLTPNYSNAVLELGKTYSMTAKAASGFVFTNWTGGLGSPLALLTNKPAVQFIMQSNLTLQANFIDVMKPTVAITNPASGQRLSNAVTVVRGTAKDNDLVTNVVYSLNGAPFQSASGTTNWAATISMPAGTNVIVVRSVDKSGLESLSVTSRFFFVVSSPLTLITNGLGTITRNFTGTNLEVGRGYTVTAVPGSGQVFSNWVGGVNSSVAALNFLMQSNLLLQANFIANPFIPVQGGYNGLFYDTNGIRHESSGFFTLTLTASGSYSGSLQMGSSRLALAGQFDVAGNATKVILRPGTNAITINLSLDLAPGGDRLSGTLSNGLWLAELSADRVVTNLAAQYAGMYTMIVPGSDGDVTLPSGDSYGAVSVDHSGKIKLSGSLADGTALSQKTVVSKTGQWRMYAALYGGKGSILGWMTFTYPPADLAGWLNWIKPVAPTTKLYPGGFSHEVTNVAGSRYTPPSGTNRVMNLTNGAVIFEGGNLTAPFTNRVFLTTGNKVTNSSANKLTLTLVLPSGLFNGNVTVPGTTRSLPIKGALLTNQNIGSGFFLDTNQSGHVFFAPQ